MAIWRLQVEVAGDTVFPRDRAVITPHFNNTQTTFLDEDVDSLCEDLATALVGYFNEAREIRVTGYDAQGTPPVFPQGQAVRNVGLAPESQKPREIAVCLSFYAGVNRPKRRGRLYIPWFATNQGVGSPRPTVANRQKVADLVPILADLGGANVDWGVYSRTDDAFFKATNWWVDDEWDTMRSRGLRPAARTAGATSG